MEFSIIIPTFNREVSLKRTLESIYKQNLKGLSFEVIIVDDGSSDNTKKIVSAFSSKYGNVLYFYQKNAGPGSARNLGLKKAKGKYVVFTDDDVVVDKNWLNNIKITFEKTGADGVGGSVYNPYNSSLSWAHYFLHFCKWLPSRNSGYIDNIPTLNVAYRQSSIKGLKFDLRSAEFGYEDSLFNYEFVKKGNKLYFESSINVKHYCWDNLSYKKMFSIQRRTAKGFFNGGFKVHEGLGAVLTKYKFLNLALPVVIYATREVFYSKFILRFLLAMPLMIIFETYKGIYILFKI